MQKQVSQILLLFVVLVAVLGGGYVWLSLPLLKMREQVRLYDGDGQIRNESYLFLFTPMRGYSVQFEPFSLERPHHASYRLSALPQADLDALIVFNATAVGEKQDFGSIRISLRDSSGKLVQSLQTDSPQELIWSHIAPTDATPQPQSTTAAEATAVAEQSKTGATSQPQADPATEPQKDATTNATTDTDTANGHYELYSAETSHFTPVSGEVYELTIDFEPSANAATAPATGYLGIRVRAPE